MLDPTIEADIPGAVMWSVIDSKHSVSMPYHDGLLVDMINDGLDDEIDGIAVDFAIHIKEVTLPALDSITKEVKRLS